MADDQDIADLLRGELDMARRDFKQADLSGRDLQGRDFTGAHLAGAHAARANFSKCTMRGMRAAGMSAPEANFSGIMASGTAFLRMDLRGSSFRDANISRSHFTGVDFSGADLRGADFSRTKLNEGCRFDDCLVDESTRFDGAEVFRPLARLSAFKFYRVERGVLIRRETPPSEAIFRVEAAVEPSDIPPRFPEIEGDFEVDIRLHDGHLIFGSDDWQFVTRWSTTGTRAIHAYRNLPTVDSLAIAVGVNKLEDVTSAVLARSAFTSQHLTPGVGEVLLLKSGTGLLCAVELTGTELLSPSKPGRYFRGRYRIFVDGPQDLGRREGDQPNKVLISAIDDALAALNAVTPAPKQKPGEAGIGHNNPPSEAALSEDDYEAVRVALVRLRAGTRETFARAALEESRGVLQEASQSIMSWARGRLEQFGDGFFTQLGATLADPKTLLGAYLILSGKLDAVVSLVTRLLLD